MITRREFFAAGSAGLYLLGMPPGSIAQQQGKVWRIGFLGAAAASYDVPRMEALRAGLRDLGYEEGRNFVIEYRVADGKYERLPELAAELVRLKVDVIVTYGTPGSRAAKQATTTIPIVMAPVGDPVGGGLVASLARPGGNITGLTFFTLELAAKRLELLKDAFPRIRQIAVLVNADNPILASANFHALEQSAKTLKVVLSRFEVREPKDIESAFAAITKQHIDAVAVDQDSVLNANNKLIADIAARHRLPVIGSPGLATAGALIGYGATSQTPRAAYFVDKILKGTKPADIPVEQATRFELIVNLKTAKALGVKIPPSIFVRANKVIE